MYEVYTLDPQSDPNFEELIRFDSLRVALAFSKIRVLFSSLAGLSSIWKVENGKRTKIYRTLWLNREPTTIEPDHELWHTDFLLSYIREERGSSDGMQKSRRKR